MLKELTTYIGTNVAGLTLAVGASKNLYAGERPPDSPSTSVWVRESAPGIRDPHPELSDMGQTPFDVMVQGADYITVRDLASDIFTALHAKTQIELPVVESGPTYLVNIRCTDPYNAGPDDRNHPVMAVGVLVAREEI